MNDSATPALDRDAPNRYNVAARRDASFGLLTRPSVFPPIDASQPLSIP
jgi:hypothetical protein